jgi:O-antigen biosynthesis protein
MLRRKIRSFRVLLVKLGVSGVIKYIWNLSIQKTRRLFRMIIGYQGHVDVFEHYEFLTRDFFGDKYLPGIHNVRVINWVIPDVGIGSGGHLNIFRLIMHLEQCGYVCRIIIVGGSQFASGENARATIREHFFPINAEVSIGEASLQPAQFTIATSWITAYSVRNFQGAGNRCYFVQDFEPFFYAHGSDYYFAEETYRMGFFCITAGQWLANKLSKEFGMKTFAMGFSYDHDLYFPRPRKDPQKKRAFFYARPVTFRRGFELGLLALNMVAQQYPDVEFVLAGWDISEYRIPFRHINAGNVAVKDLPDLYSQCDVALVVSLTNLSLLPLELMACGCPVVSNKGDNVEWLLNDQNSVLAETTPEALCEAIVSVLNNDHMRENLISQGLDFAASTSWSTEAKKIADVLNEMIAVENFGRKQ